MGKLRCKWMKEYEEALLKKEISLEEVAEKRGIKLASAKRCWNVLGHTRRDVFIKKADKIKEIQAYHVHCDACGEFFVFLRYNICSRCLMIKEEEKKAL